MKQPFGKELILDIHECKAGFFRDSIEQFFEELCGFIGMEREDLHWWDYEGDPEGYDAAADHLKGISAIQFITTSNIVIHTLDVSSVVYLNIFSCKSFDENLAAAFAEWWFSGDIRSAHNIERL